MMLYSNLSIRQATSQQLLELLQVTIFFDDTLSVFFATDQLHHPRLSGNLRHRRQETSSVHSHWYAICTQDNDHAGDEKFRGCGPSHLEQFTSRSANCYSLPSGVRSTFEGPPVWLIGSASEDYL